METSKSSEDVRTAISMARDDLAWIRASLEGLEIKGDHRHRIPGQLFDLSIEHHAGIITLISMATYASAFALVRCAFECFVRGAWIHYCASEQEIEAFVEKDTIAPKFGDLIKAIEERPEFSVKFLSTVKQSAWSAMNGYGLPWKNWSNSRESPLWRRIGESYGTSTFYAGTDHREAA